MKLYHEAFKSCGGLGASDEADIICICCAAYSFPPVYPKNSGTTLPASCDIPFPVYIACDGA